MSDKCRTNYGHWPQSRSASCLTSAAAGRRDVCGGQTSDSHQSMDWWVITFAICSVMPIPVVPVRPMVAIQARVVPVPVTVAATGSTASHRVFATRSGTVLRYREGTSTRQQYYRHHDAFQDGHVASPTRRRTHPTAPRRTPMEPGPFRWSSP
jgi:hypothetical protein